jgi:hypothetical protein
LSFLLAFTKCKILLHMVFPLQRIHFFILFFWQKCPLRSSCKKNHLPLPALLTINLFLLCIPNKLPGSVSDGVLWTKFWKARAQPSPTWLKTHRQEMLMLTQHYCCHGYRICLVSPISFFLEVCYMYMDTGSSFGIKAWASETRALSSSYFSQPIEAFFWKESIIQRTE